MMTITPRQLGKARFSLPIVCFIATVTLIVEPAAAASAPYHSSGLGCFYPTVASVRDSDTVIQPVYPNDPQTVAVTSFLYRFDYARRTWVYQGNYWTRYGEAYRSGSVYWYRTDSNWFNAGSGTWRILNRFEWFSSVPSYRADAWDWTPYCTL